MSDDFTIDHQKGILERELNRSMWLDKLRVKEHGGTDMGFDQEQSDRTKKLMAGLDEINRTREKTKIEQRLTSVDTEELVAREEMACSACGRKRHLTCPKCMERNLTGNKFALEHHNGQAHICGTNVVDRRGTPSVSGGGVSFPGMITTVRDEDVVESFATIFDAAKKELQGRADGGGSDTPGTPGAGEGDEGEKREPQSGENDKGRGEGNTREEEFAKKLFELLKPEMEKLASDAKADESLDARFTEKFQEGIEQAADEAVQRIQPPIKIEIRTPDSQVFKDIKGQHKQFHQLLTLLGAGLNVFLVGPAGSGKTKASFEAAKVLDLTFYPKSVGPATTEHSMMGYQDANGRFVPGILHAPFTSGGLLLLDEMDSANAAATTTLNTALANEYCSFPHKVEQKHASFRVVASGNTYGKGADRMYVGRAQLDAATLNRFSVINWEYDEGLERTIAESLAKSLGCKKIMDWLQVVHDVRAAIDFTGARIIASTRDIIDGGIAVSVGMNIKEVAQVRFWNSMDKDTMFKIQDKIKDINRERKLDKRAKTRGS